MTKLIKTITVTLMGLTVLLSSCQEHEEVIDTSLKVGNILCSNGSIVPPQLYDDTKNGIGVIVCVGGEEDAFKAIAVARHDIGHYAYADTLVSFDNVSTDVTLLDGKTNTAALEQQSNEEPSIHVPAARAATGFKEEAGDGWYLPSCAELRALANSKAVVGKSLDLIGGNRMDEEDWYLSSTQDGTSEGTKTHYAYCVSMQGGGRMKSMLKKTRGLVRPFIMIE